MTKYEDRLQDTARLIMERAALEKAGMVYVPMTQERRKVLLMNPVWRDRAEKGEIKVLIRDGNPSSQIERLIWACMFPTKELAAAFLAESPEAAETVQEIATTKGNDLDTVLAKLSAMDKAKAKGATLTVKVDEEGTFTVLETFDPLNRAHHGYCWAVESKDHKRAIYFSPKRGKSLHNKLGRAMIRAFKKTEGVEKPDFAPYGPVIVILDRKVSQPGEIDLLDREPISHTLN